MRPIIPSTLGSLVRKPLPLAVVAALLAFVTFPTAAQDAAAELEVPDELEAPDELDLDALDEIEALEGPDEFEVPAAPPAAEEPVMPEAEAEDVQDIMEAFGDPSEGETVQSIDVRYVGPQTIDRQRILALLATSVGQPFSLDDTDRDIRNLIGSGEVENARVLTEPVAGGVRVIVVVETRAALASLRFMGNEQIDSRRLGREVPISVGETVSELSLLEGKQKIEQLYANRGFPDVRVDYQVRETDREGFQDVVFTIDEGDESWIRNINFEGNTIASDRELRGAMETKPRGLFSFITRSGRLDSLVMQRDIGSIERFYQDRGYLRARVVDVRRVAVPERAGRVDLVITVEEGEIYEVASVSIEGMRIFQREDIMPEISLRANEPYSASKVARDEQLIRDYYGSEGYAEARVDTIISQAEGNLINVVYSVHEGGRFFVGRVNISGNHKTKDKVIRREVTVAPGDVFNTVEMDASRRRLQTTGYFSEVDTMMADSDPGYKDLDINVVEQNTGELQFGAGFSSIDNIVGFVSVSQTNFDLKNPPTFTGAGQNFNFQARIGTKRKDVVIGLEEPYFMDRRLAVGGELFFRDLAFLSDVYEQQDIGGLLRVRHPLTEFSFLQAEYTLQQVKIHKFTDQTSDEIRAEGGEFLQSKIQLSYVIDTRDEILVPRRGGRYTVSTMYSGGVLGGDADVYGLGASGLQYFLLPYDLIFSLQGEVDAVDSYGGAEVPIFERLFLGGARNLRGFSFRDVGPRDGTGEPIGGLTSVFGSAELTYPTMFEPLRGAVFYDIGLVSADSFSFSGNFNSNFGFGLRLNLRQLGPIALDYGIPIATDEFNDSSGRFQFSAGIKF